MSMNLAARCRAFLHLFVGDRSPLGDERVIDDDSFAAGAFETDGEPVVNDLDVFARKQHPAALGWSLLSFAFDRHGCCQPVAVIYAAREEALAGPAVASVHWHHVTCGCDD